MNESQIPDSPWGFTPPPYVPPTTPPVGPPTSPPYAASMTGGIGGPDAATPSTPKAPKTPRRRVGATVTLAAALLAGVAGGAIGGYGVASFGEDTPATNSTIVESSASSATGDTVDGTTVSVSPLSVSQILDRVGDSVVAIETEVVQRRGPYVQTGSGTGTGVILTADGQVLTNAHVVSGASAVVVTVVVDGQATQYDATVLASDASNDLALLQLTDASGLPAAPIGDSDAAAVGDDVIAVGNALALEGSMSVTRGIVSALDRTITAGTDTSTETLDGLIQTDAAISSGNSGGALVNSAGEVIGINTAVASSGGGTQASNIGFVIPINAAMDIVGQMRQAIA